MSKLIDLSSGSGLFSYVIPITDKAGTWNLKDATLQLASPTGEVLKTIKVEIDITSPSVNTMPPEILVSAERNKLIYSIANVSPPDSCSLRVYCDNVEMTEYSREIGSDIRRKTIELKPGTHDYKITATDLAGNQAAKQLYKVTQTE